MLTDKRTIVFRVDDTFSKGELADLRYAMSMWEHASGDRLSLSFYTDNITYSEIFFWATDGRPTIYNASSFAGWQRHVAQFMTSSTTGVLGAAFSITGDVFMIDDTPGKFRIVAAHEIGHILLGDYHAKDPDSLMYYKLGNDYKNKTITAVEIKMLGDLFGKE